jgi:hypothetical protein
MSWFSRPIPLSVENRCRAAWAMFFGSVIGWPVTALTIFREEPQGILGLSWLALTITGFDTNVTYVSKLSELALAFACLAAYQSVRGERKADVLIDAVPGAEDPDR